MSHRQFELGAELDLSAGRLAELPFRQRWRIERLHGIAGRRWSRRKVADTLADAFGGG